MKKVTALLLVIVLLVGVLPLPTAAAVPIGDLTALAAYMPADTELYIGIRTDDGFVETLDGLLAAVIAHLPAGTVSRPVSLAALLDEAAGELVPGGDFQSVFRSWLGNTAALGVPSLASQYSEEVAIALDITDRAAAEQFVDRLAVEGHLERTTWDGYTLYTDDPAGNNGILIGDEVAIIAVGMLDQVQGEARLDTNPNFAGAFDPLPQDDYNILLWIDMEAVVAAQMREAGNAWGSGMSAQMSVGTPALAIGFTLLDGRVLTMDIAAQVDLESIAAEGSTLPTTPIDLAFAGYLPADAQYVVQGANLWASYQALLQNLRAMAEAEGTDPEEIDSGLQMLNIMIKGALDLSLEQDILSWMTGDYALYFRGERAFLDRFFEDPEAALNLEAWPFDFGLVVEATDPTAAQYVIAALSDSLPALLALAPAAEVEVTQETIGSGNVIVLSIPVEGEGVTLPPFELLIGASDEVLVLGTRSAVTAALTPGEGLDSAAGFVAAAPYLLENPTSIGYVSSDGVAFLADTVTALAVLGPSVGDIYDEILTDLEYPSLSTPTPAEREQRQRQREAETRAALRAAQTMRRQMLEILRMVENLTFSAVVREDGTYLLRGTIALTFD